MTGIAAAGSGIPRFVARSYLEFGGVRGGGLAWSKIGDGGMEPELRGILQRLRARLEELYGDRLLELILFGSRARGEAHPESDIDLLVVLDGPVEPATEIARTGHIVTELSLEHDVVIGCVFIDEDRYRTRAGPLLRNVRKEGILV